ncbi:MAG: hypothetical protein JAZ19_03845 [Candidatus Thiodiazotropha taylori]|nr:hypothetical protein [Candidatus Thiodiazotropha taylori]
MKDIDKFTQDLLEVLQDLPPESHLPYIKRRLGEIEDTEQRNTAEILISIGIEVGFKSQPNEEVIVLIHGIRTFAEWFDLIKNEIESNSNASVYFIKYGYLDVVRFWFPIWTRSHTIKHVKQQLRIIRDKHRTDDFVIVAHSFGTYIVSKILETESDIDIKRLLLCGSIIRENYRWDLLPKPPSPVLNDCGLRDNWPIVAKTLSWGYGTSGSFGLNSTHITNRYFDLNHSGFFTEDFIRKYWMPYIIDKKIEPSPLSVERPKPFWVKSLISILPIQWVILIVAFAFLGKSFF